MFACHSSPASSKEICTRIYFVNTDYVGLTRQSARCGSTPQASGPWPLVYAPEEGEECRTLTHGTCIGGTESRLVVGEHCWAAVKAVGLAELG